MAFSVADIQGRWAEPVQRKAFGAWLQQTQTEDTRLIPQSGGMILGRYPPLAEPVRLKVGLGTWLQHYVEIVPPAYYGPPIPVPNSWLEAIHESNWHYPLSEPIWLSYRVSIRTGSQQGFAGPARLLPPVSVSVSLSAVETLEDVAEIAANVYNAEAPTVDLTGARVSVAEISDSDESNVSIRTE